MTIKLFLKITPNARKQGFGNVIAFDNKKYIKLAINAPAIENKANEAIISFLSAYFKINKKTITITCGLTSKYKTVTINEENQELIKLEALLKNDN